QTGVDEYKWTKAGREYYVSMCPMRLIPRIFLFDEDELKPELRSQRILNKTRVPEMARYLTSNPKNYTFSALTASIDGKVRFEALGEDDGERNIGRLHVPMNSKFVINDGQHRRAAIEAALHENPDLGDETISVVFFLDVGLKRCQQMFADLNRHAIRPTPSLGLLYDHRDSWASIAKNVVSNVAIFTGLTEMERSTISNRSIKLFTLSGIHNATHTLLSSIDLPDDDARVRLATEFWDIVGNLISDWTLAKDRKVSSAELRQDYVHSHTLALAALARVGNALLATETKDWKGKLKKLSSLDWSRGNRQWEGRAMSAGRLSKRNVNVTLTANLIKKHLGLPLTLDEQQLEHEYNGERNGNKKAR
ncbi:MAG: DNA sulfur modification protein DndB, partial [Pirellula sp.]